MHVGKQTRRGRRVLNTSNILDSASAHGTTGVPTGGIRHHRLECDELVVFVRGAKPSRRTCYSDPAIAVTQPKQRRSLRRLHNDWLLKNPRPNSFTTDSMLQAFGSFMGRCASGCMAGAFSVPWEPGSRPGTVVASHRCHGGSLPGGAIGAFGGAMPPALAGNA